MVEPSGDRHAFEVLEHEWTIATVSQRVEAATGIPPAQQVLKYGQRVLRPGKRLTSCAHLPLSPISPACTFACALAWS